METDGGCRIWSAVRELEGGAAVGVAECVARHNFVGQVKFVVPRKASLGVKTAFEELEAVEIEAHATFQQVLMFLLGLEDDLRRLVKFVPLGKDITHQSTFSIAYGTVTVKLDEELYRRSGLKLKRSAFSQGNRRFVNQMFIGSFDLETFGKTNDPNDMRLLWFAANVDTERYHLGVTGDSPAAQEALRGSGMDIKVNNFEVSFEALDSCAVPSFDINQDEDDQNEILQWLIHEGEEHEVVELDKSMDPYAVHFEEPVEVVDEIDVDVLIVKSSSLIPSSVALALLKTLDKMGCWYGMGSIGHKHVLKSFGSKGEHGFKNDGSNNLFAFVNEQKSIQWKVMDRSDPN